MFSVCFQKFKNLSDFILYLSYDDVLDVQSSPTNVHTSWTATCTPYILQGSNLVISIAELPSGSAAPQHQLQGTQA